MGISTTDSARALESTTETANAAYPVNPHLPSVCLPDEPLVTIEPTRSWLPINFGDLWTYRELLYFMTWRDIKVRYKQTVLGVMWVVLQPLLMTLIFTVFLGVLARVPSGGIPYGLFVYSGLTAWSFISSAVLTCSGSLVGNANLITKIYFPRIIVPTAAIIARLVDFAIAFIILVALMFYYGVPPTRALLMLPIIVVLMTLFSWGLGVWMSALNVKYRDIGIGLPVAIQLCLFLSPVVYPATLVPARWQRLYALNPFVGIIQGFRTSLLGGQFDWWALTISFVATGALLVCAAYAFRRTEKTFADII